MSTPGEVIAEAIPPISKYDENNRTLAKQILAALEVAGFSIVKLEQVGYGEPHAPWEWTGWDDPDNATPCSGWAFTDDLCPPPWEAAEPVFRVRTPEEGTR